MGADGTGLSPKLFSVIHDTQPERKFPAVIVIPGGSYDHCSKREGEPCAARWYSQGFNGFVLEYSCRRPFPAALAELAAAVCCIRKNAEELCCDGRIILCGFSAGGHLAAGLCAHFKKYSGLFEEDIRPDGAVLCYPVITSDEYTHKPSMENISSPDTEKSTLSIEKNVSVDFPPTFIWHCADDKTVPVENSLLLSAALSRKNVPFELHIFPKGGHGIAMCDITTIKNDDPRYLNPTAAQWFGLALDWAERNIK